MKYKKLKTLSTDPFRRLTGVHKQTFKKMIEVLSEADKIKKSKSVRPSKLSTKDKLLITLEYLREYRTYFHISTNYGLSKSNRFEVIRWVENTLINPQRLNVLIDIEIIEKDLN